MPKIEIFRPREIDFVGGPYDGWKHDLGGQPIQNNTPWFHDILRDGVPLNAFCIYRYHASTNRMVYDSTQPGSYRDCEEYKLRVSDITPS